MKDTVEGALSVADGEGFELSQVVSVVMAKDSMDEEAGYGAQDFVGVFRLDNGKYGWVSAGCDVSGWCYGGGKKGVVSTVEAALLAVQS